MPCIIPPTVGDQTGIEPRVGPSDKDKMSSSRRRTERRFALLMALSICLVSAVASAPGSLETGGLPPQIRYRVKSSGGEELARSTIEVISRAASFVLTWPTPFKSPGDPTTFTLSGASKRDLFVFSTRDGGATWLNQVINTNL
jgi:hypothetical protein